MLRIVCIVVGVVVLSGSSRQYHFPPSILTFNEEYVGKEMGGFLGGSDEIRRGDAGDDADSLLPLCCDFRSEDVISFNCLNSLSKSPKESGVFNRATWIAPQHLVSSKTSTKFRFISSSFRCKNAKVMRPRLSLNSTGGQKGTYFLLDGYFKYQNEYYRPDEFCVSGISKDEVEVQICPVNCRDPNTPCIHKCCGKDQIYSFGYGDHPRGCVDVEEGGKKWYPSLYHSLRKRLSPSEALQLNPHIVHKFPTSFKYGCRFNKTTVFPHGKGIAGFLTTLTQKNFRNLEFRVRKDGALLYPKESPEGPNSEMAKHIENYCIDGAQDYGESSDFENLESETVLFLCSGGVDEDESESISTTSAPSTTPKTPGSSSASEKIPGIRPLVTLPPRVPLPTSSTLLPSPVQRVPVLSVIPVGAGIPGSSGPGDQMAESSQLTPHTHPEIPPSSIIADSPAKHSVEVSNSVEDGELPEVEEDSSGSNRTSPFPGVSFTPEDSLFPSVSTFKPRPVSILATAVNPNLQVKRKKKPGLSQTTFNHNNHEMASQEQQQEKEFLGTGGHPPLKKYADIKLKNKKRPTSSIPMCCDFSSDVNDGTTHHCRNRRMEVVPTKRTGRTRRELSVEIPTWNVPKHFMSKDKSLTFSLSTSPVTCNSGKFQFQGFIHNFEQERGKYAGEKRHGFLDDGYLKYDNEFYSPGEYCINGLSPRIVEVLICKPDCSLPESPCIQKCCGLDEIYNLGLSSGLRGCQPLTSEESRFNPTLFHEMKTPLSDEERAAVAPHFVQKYPPSFQQNCFNKITLAFPFSKKVAGKLTPADSSERGGVSFKHLSFRFRKDGKLIYSYPEPDGSMIDSVYDRGEFCVDGVRDYGESETFRNFENQTILFICASEPHSSEAD